MMDRKTDIAPELLQKLQNVFRKKVEEDPALNNIRKKMAEKSAGSEDAECFSVRIGELLGETFGEVLQPGTLPNDIMYYNIASRIVPPLMKEEFNYVSNASVDIIRIQNEQHGGSLARTIVNRTKINPNRIDGMVNLACSKPFPAVKRTFLEAMVNFAQNVNAQTVHQNAEDNYRMGFSPKLHRKSSGNCCKWCSEKAGDYDYRPKMDRDVFRRHANCRCQILYDPDGTGKRLLDSLTKKWGAEKELRKQNQERLKRQEEVRTKQPKGKELEREIRKVEKNKDDQSTVLLKKLNNSPAEMFRLKGETHQKTGDLGQKIISKALYNKITKPAIKAGAEIIVADAEWEAHLKKANATASTIGNIIIFSKQATVTDVLEEVHHFYQNKAGMNDAYGETQRTILNEIDAKEYLLRNEKKYKIPTEETELTKKQLASYLREMDELKRAGDWE